MEKIVYLLGAGASANALPTVKHWNERVEYYLSVIKNISTVDHLLPELRPLRGISAELHKKFNWVFEESKKHHTFDTYAKKLFIRNTKEDRYKLRILKVLLGSYFIFEQEYSKIQVVMPHNYLPPGKVDIVPEIWTALDYRYDVFFASILSPGLRILPVNINIVSWNYDYQLELALSDYLQTRHIEEARSILRTDFIDDSKKQYYKLNGTASFIIGGRNNYPYSTIYGSDLDFELVPYLLHFKETVINEVRKDQRTMSDISFAWEKHHGKVQLVKEAALKVSEAQTVVVCGYSFPTFNREIDRSLFKDFKGDDKRIVVQEYNQEAFNRVFVRLKDVLRNPYWKDKKLETRITFYSEIDQFYLPV